MKISLNWIKEFVDVPKKLSARELAELLTLRTCEVEGWEDQAEKFEKMVIGKVLEIKPHPNADKLKLCRVDIGDTAVQIVCAGMNVKPNMLVAAALPGARVKWHGAGESVELKETDIRGEKSYGMICAGEEIGMEPDNTKDSKEIRIKDLSFLEVEPGTPLAGALHLDDVIFEIDNKSLTHRPDLWGHYGMAREFSVFLKKPLKPISPKVVFPKTGVKVKIDIEKNDICARFLSAIITGIKIEESPQWLKTRLLAVGVRPVNNIVDITNFVMLELGQPMHAFDRRVVENDNFVIRYAHPNEEIETLDHKKRKLSTEDALVTNGQRNLALAGVMGGLNSEITEKTAEIILEVATWNPVMIRKTSKRHDLRSDAAQRFEKSLDPEMAKTAFLRACELILQLCPGAKLAGPFTDEYVKKPKPTMVLLDEEKTNRKIGVKISEKEMMDFLKALGFGVAKSRKGFLKVAVPSFRATKDVDIEDDLVEEIARMYGYEKIQPILPDLPIKLPHENRERTLKHRSRNILSRTLGFTEISLYSFYKKEDFEKCFLPEEPHFLIENPLSEDQTHLRTSLLPNMLKTVAKNLDTTDNLKIYEIGRRYKKMSGSYFPLEEKIITGMVVSKKPKGEIFYEAKGAMEKFLELFPAQPWIFEESKEIPPFAHPKKCADVFVQTDKRNLIGQVFELHPQVAKNFGIDASVAVFGINFSILANLPLLERKYSPLPRFPGIDFDVSFLAPKLTRHADVKRLIRQSDQNFIHKVELIDIFENPGLGENKKSMTYRISLLSGERTLTDEDMNFVRNKVSSRLERENYSVRT